MTRIRIDTSYTAVGEPRFKAIRTAVKPSEIKTSRRRAGTKVPVVKPRAYLKLLGMNFTRYLNVVADEVPVDVTGSGLVWNVWTCGGTRGARHVDTWAELELAPDARRTGFTALASVRTPWNIWVPGVAGERGFVRAAAVEIMRATGVKHPSRSI